MQSWRRTRWRLRGAWQWPVFAVITLVDATLVHLLPLAGDGTGWVAALLLVGCFNLVAVAVLGRVGGALLRRRRPDLPAVVADDYAGTAALVSVALILLTAGLLHRPAVLAARDDFAAQSRQARRWVAAFGEPVHRANIERADSIKLEEDLYRTCVPENDPRRWLCLLVNTATSPPTVTRDPSGESNASLNRPGGFR